MDSWCVVEPVFEPEKLHHRGSIFTIGNGYLGTRGTYEEGYPGEQASTFIHGVFDDIPIAITELANTPNWLDFNLFAGGCRFGMDRERMASYHRELDLRSGALMRKIRWQHRSGATLELAIERFTSLADEHVQAIRYQVTSLDFQGELEFRAGLPGHVDNTGWVHWEWSEQGRLDQQSAYLQLITKATNIQLCEAFHLSLSAAGQVHYEYWDSTWVPTLVARTSIQPGEQVTAEKLVAVFTSRDGPDPKASALEKITAVSQQRYQSLRADNDSVWTREWERCNIDIEGDEKADRALRFSLFQLLIAAPRHEERASIGAKTLSGFGYRGHVFWDTEIFLLPFFTFTRPEIARNLLMYRYHTLPGARRKAQLKGYEGAMYAWESAATGDETTPRWVYGPDGKELVRIWCGDIEHHISADVAYSVFQYWQVSGDDAFMRDYGAEVVLDTARFWGSRVEWNAEAGRYEINDVIGPDEYHDHVDNNAYTNVLARWNLQVALRTLDWLREQYPDKAVELGTSLDLTSHRLARWNDIVEKLYLAFDSETGLFDQFEGFFQLKKVNLRDYEPRSRSMQAILGIEGIQETQIIKQPDVLMLLYLLGDAYDHETLKRNWETYTPLTDLTYGSSLGPAIQSILAVRLDKIEAAYQHFMHAAQTDLEDLRGNTADGAHAATAGGCWQAMVFGFGGVQLVNGMPAAHPRLPQGWRRLKFSLQARGQRFEFDLRPDSGPDVSAALTAPPGRLPILGAIFDLDGVLTDTSEYHYLAWKRLAGELDIPFDRQANEALRGISRRESLLLLLNERSHSEAEMTELMDRKNRYYQEYIAGLTPADLLPGARQLLASLRSAGIKIAIGSASRNAAAVIEKLGIGGMVDAISDGSSVSRQKPAPDLFLHAAHEIQVSPNQCVVFEDAQAGITAALEAGMWVVGIGPQERVGAAHLVIPGFAGVTWKNLLSDLEQAQSAK